MEKERGLTKTNFGQCNFTWPLWVQRNPLNRWVEEDAQVRGRGGNLMSVESRSGTIPEESRFTIPFLWGGNRATSSREIIEGATATMPVQ